ncbi:hypothetical protein MMC34_008360 [Xylographa carneopallida]|nr:hypothetical protein [Xylographa carneopallida]
MLREVRGAEAGRGASRAKQRRGSAASIDLSRPLTVLSCQPLLPLPPATVPASLVQLAVLPSRLPLPASSALHSAAVSSVAHLLLIQRTSTGHHYLFNYGTQPIRHNGRRLQQQRLSLRAHVSRCALWQSEAATGQPHTERSEVQGSGGKALDDGDAVQLQHTKFVYWSHQHATQPHESGVEAESERRKSSRTRAAPQQKRQRQRQRRTVHEQADREQTGEAATKRGEKSEEEEARSEDENRERERGGGASAGSISAGAPRRGRSRRARMSLTAKARIAAFARQRERAPNGAFLRVQANTERSAQRGDSGEGKEEEEEEEEDVEEGSDEAVGEERMETASEASGGEEELAPSTSRRLTRRRAAGSVTAAERRRRKRRKLASGDGVLRIGAQELHSEHEEEAEAEKDRDEEEEQSNSDAVAAVSLRAGRGAAPGRSSRAAAVSCDRAQVSSRQRRRVPVSARVPARAEQSLDDGEEAEPVASPASRPERSATRQRRRRGAQRKQRASTAAAGEEGEAGLADRRRAQPHSGGAAEQSEQVASDMDEDEDEDADMEAKSAAESAHSSEGGQSPKRAVSSHRAARRRAGGVTRHTRSSGPAPVFGGDRQWPEADGRRVSRKRRSASRAAKKPTPLRRMRRTPLSLLPNLLAPLLPLIPLLTCGVCTQLFVQPVTLPCSHSFCAYCLHVRLQLKQSACPGCDAAVSDEARRSGTYAVLSASLATLAESVSAQCLDVKGRRARARRLRVDAADMKAVRAAWKRRQGAEKSRERRQRERQRVEEELAALLGRRRRGQSGRGDGGSSSRRVGPRDESGSDSDDDEFVPASESQSEDTSTERRSDSRSSSDTDGSSGRTASDRTDDDSGSRAAAAAASSSSSSSSTAAGSSDSIASSEEDSVDMDRSLILPPATAAARRSRPQRTRYELLYVPKRSRPPCRACSLPLGQTDLAVRVLHGADVRWTHIACLRFSSAGRTIPLHRLDGLHSLGASEQQQVRQAWHREADDGPEAGAAADDSESGREQRSSSASDSASDEVAMEDVHG